MAGATKLLTASGGGVTLTPASSIASDITVNVPVTGVNGGTIVCSDSSGNVGIGTSAPGGYKLNVSADAVPAYVNSTNGNSNVLAVAASGTIGGWIGASSANLILTPASSNNAVLINKTTAADPINNKLEVRGWGYFKHASGDTVLNVDSATNPSFSLSLNGAAKATAVFSSGFLYFGTTASAGDWYITKGAANVAVVTSSGVTNISDARLKSNIQPATVGLNEISKLSAKTYERNGAEELGLIAQEIEAAGIPFVVTEHGDGKDGTIKAVNSFGMIAALVNAVNELKTELDATKAEVAALKGAA